jgi:hypothetical protein
MVRLSNNHINAISGIKNEFQAVNVFSMIAVGLGMARWPISRPMNRATGAVY